MEKQYVYLVSDQEERKYALKKMNIQVRVFLNNQIKKSKETLQNIKQEVNLWSKVNSSNNIVKMIDYEITDTCCLILMELCTGKYFNPFTI